VHREHAQRRKHHSISWKLQAEFDRLLNRHRDKTGNGADAKTSIAARVHGAAVRQLTLEEVQDLYIDEVMALHGGNKVHAAAALGIDRKTLYRRAERRARRTSADGATVAEGTTRGPDGDADRS